MAQNRIVIAIHSLHVGGMERVASALANSFCVKNELDVHIVLFGINPEIFYKLDGNIRIHRPNFKFNNENRTLSTLRTLFYLRNKFKILKPDTILSFGESWNNLTLLANLYLKFPIYISDRSTPLKDLGRFQNMLRKLLYPSAKGLILQTNKAKKKYRSVFPNSTIYVIGNPISIMKYPNPEIPKENIILNVGRLIATKNIERLINIFERTEKDNWKLVIVGDDAKKQHNREKFERLIEKLNLKEKVYFAGKQSEIEGFYYRSKIFAFTSSSEGFPNVICEAMSAGLPVVAYDCEAGPSEIIKDGQDGFLIPLFDDEQFKDKLELLMKDESLRLIMGSAARENIKRFDVDLISEQFLSTILDQNEIIN